MPGYLLCRFDKLAPRFDFCVDKVSSKEFAVFFGSHIESDRLVSVDSSAKIWIRRERSNNHFLGKIFVSLIISGVVFPGSKFDSAIFKIFNGNMIGVSRVEPLDVDIKYPSRFIVDNFAANRHRLFRQVLPFLTVNFYPITRISLRPLY